MAHLRVGSGTAGNTSKGNRAHGRTGDSTSATTVRTTRLVDGATPRRWRLHPGPSGPGQATRTPTARLATVVWRRGRRSGAVHRPRVMGSRFTGRAFVMRRMLPSGGPSCRDGFFIADEVARRPPGARHPRRRERGPATQVRRSSRSVVGERDFQVPLVSLVERPGASTTPSPGGASRSVHQVPAVGSHASAAGPGAAARRCRRTSPNSGRCRTPRTCGGAGQGDGAFGCLMSGPSGPGGVCASAYTPHVTVAPRRS